MSNTMTGAKKGVKTMRLRHGNTHYERIGQIGGLVPKKNNFDKPGKGREAALKRWHPEDYQDYL